MKRILAITLLLAICMPLCACAKADTADEEVKRIIGDCQGNTVFLDSFNLAVALPDGVTSDCLNEVRPKTLEELNRIIADEESYAVLSADFNTDKGPVSIYVQVMTCEEGMKESDVMNYFYASFPNDNNTLSYDVVVAQLGENPYQKGFESSYISSDGNTEGVFIFDKISGGYYVECFTWTYGYSDAKKVAENIFWVDSQIKTSDGRILTVEEACSDAQSHYEAGEYTAAKELWEKAADMGSPDAMCGLGDIYSNNSYDKRDLEEALRWYSEAEKAGHTDINEKYAAVYYACYQDGISDFFAGAESNEVYEKVRYAMDNGNISAINAIGVFDILGIGCDVNTDEGIELLIKAAGYGSNDAEKNISKLLDVSENHEYYYFRLAEHDIEYEHTEEHFRQFSDLQKDLKAAIKDADADGNEFAAYFHSKRKL